MSAANLRFQLNPNSSALNPRWGQIRGLFWGLFIVTAAACQSTIPNNPAVVVTTAPSTADRNVSADPQKLLAQAQQERQRGQHSAADLSYLRAASAFLDWGEPLQAEAAFFAITAIERHSNGLNGRMPRTSAGTSGGAFEPSPTTQYNLSDRPNNSSGLPPALYARVGAALAIYRDQFPLAESFLAGIRPITDDNTDATGQLQAQLCAAQERWSCAVRALVGVNPNKVVPALGQLSARNSQRPGVPTPDTTASKPARSVTSVEEDPATLDPVQAHNNLIWHYVNRAPIIQVQEQSQASSGVEQGWWQLQLAAISGFSAEDQRRAIDQWQRSHPNHPAQLPWPTAIEHALNPTWEPQRVALLLPLSGPLQGAGQALRNGYISAYLFDEASYELQLFDSATEDMGTVLQQVLNWQANVIIGPLAKDKLSALNALNPPIPVLGLNYLDAAEAPQLNLLQFGLAIEDEADTMIDRLLADGATNLLVLHSTADWAQRAAARITTAWPWDLTIEPVENVALVTEAVGKGMHIDDSHRRSQQIYRIIGEHIEFTPRARADIDAVVALVDNTQANAMVPALKFHFANRLPVYASAQVLRGAKADKLKELTGMRVSDLPWNMNADALANTVQDSFGLAGSSLTSLYALGTDAYRVTDRLPSLLLSTDIGLLGNTGVLSINQDRRFRRQQAWGVVKGQRLVPLPYTSSLTGAPTASGR